MISGQRGPEGVPDEAAAEEPVDMQEVDVQEAVEQSVDQRGGEVDPPQEAQEEPVGQPGALEDAPEDPDGDLQEDAPGLPAPAEPTEAVPVEEVEGTTAEAPDEPPLLEAHGLTVRTKAGTVIEPLDVVARAGEVVLVEGANGSGRSVLLLALAGRMRGVDGRLQVAGVPGTRPRRLRAVTSVARLGDVVDLDDPLTVAECVTERCLTDGVPERRGSRRMSELEDALGFRVPREAAVGELSMLSRVLLLVLLAQLRPAALTVLDDLDHDLSPDDQVLALEHLGGLARAAGAVVVTSTVAAPDPLPPGTTSLRLPTTRPTLGDVL